MIIRTRLLVAVAFAAAIIGASFETAARQRQFVRSDGSDALPTPDCTVPAPCRTLQHAAAGLDPNGELIILDSAGYGHIDITTSMSILAPGGVYGGIAVFAGNDGITVNAPGANVRFTNIFINGQGGNTGISITSAGRVILEGCSVTNMLSNGLVSSAAGARIVIRNSVFRDNGGFGVTIAGAVESTIDDVHADRNALGGFKFDGTTGTVSHSVSNDNGGTGVFVSTPSLTTTTIAISDHASSNNAGNGIDAQVSSAAAVYVTVSRSAMSGNTQHGAHAMTSGQGTARITLSYSELMANGASGATADTTSALVIVHGTTITQNPIGVQGLSLGLVRSAGNNSITNNVTDLGAGYATYTTN